MNKIITVVGSISKTEMLVPLEIHIEKGCCILEAAQPYANYYGHVPENPKPNSLFLLTTKFYFLEEVLAFAISLSDCLLDEVNFASAHLDFKGVLYPSIRIKYFPDYKKLPYLQHCLKEFGIDFQSKTKIIGQVNARIQKLFFMEEIEPGIYLDLEENNKGYIFCDRQIDAKQFSELQQNIKNNTNCGLHDSVHGEVLLDGILVKIIRVFAEGLKPSLLKCIKSEFDRIALGILNNKMTETL